MHSVYIDEVSSPPPYGGPHRGSLHEGEAGLGTQSSKVVGVKSSPPREIKSSRQNLLGQWEML